jgi:hypothetical protein
MIAAISVQFHQSNSAAVVRLQLVADAGTGNRLSAKKTPQAVLLHGCAELISRKHIEK